MSESPKKNAAEKKAGHAPLAFEDSVILATNVERLIKEQKLSYKRFCEVSGLSRPTFYNIIRAQGDPKLSSLRKIASALGVDISDLFTTPRSSSTPNRKP